MTLSRLSRLRGWHRSLALGGLVAVGLAVGLHFLRGERPLPPSSPAPSPVLAPSPVADSPALEPAQLDFTLKHTLNSGHLMLWVDEELLLEAPLRPGREEHVLAVPPGEQVVRVQLQGGGDTWLSRVRGRFKSGASSRLQAELSGLPGDRSSELVLFPLSRPKPVAP